MDFTNFFEKQGTLYLDDIKYNLISLEKDPKNIKIDYVDSVSTELIESCSKLKVIFTRRVFHVPESIFELKVSYAAIYTFKEEYIGDSEIQMMDFTTLLKTNKNTLFINIVSRTSLLISQISTSHGKIPFVTPPLYMERIHKQ